MGYPDDHDQLMISSYFQYLLIIISFSLLIMSTPTASDYDKPFNFLDDDKFITCACQTGLKDYKDTSRNVYIQKVLSLLGYITEKPAKEEYKGYSTWYGGSVNGFAQCRYDVKGKECKKCLSNAVKFGSNLCTSNNTKGVMVVHYKCFFMYTDQEFLKQPYIGFDKSSQNGPFCSGINLTIDGPQLVVRTLFESLLNYTLNAPTTIWFASGTSNATADGSVVEAMVECRRDLNPEKCTTFLSDAATNLTRLCGAQTHGAYFIEGSYVRFAWKKN